MFVMALHKQGKEDKGVVFSHRHGPVVQSGPSGFWKAGHVEGERNGERLKRTQHAVSMSTVPVNAWWLPAIP